jgi:single-strand DNA-binding protein
MATLAKIQLIGHLGSVEQSEIIIKKTGEVMQVISFSVATNYKKNDVEHVNWWQCETYNPSMKIDWFTKGKQVFIEGDMRLEEYKTKDGVEKVVPKIYARKLLFLGKREKKNVVPSTKGSTTKKR